MNVVEVEEDKRDAFEEAFLTRERLLSQAEGFVGFELLRRDRQGEYVVLTRWESQEAFRGWVQSDLFKRSHSRQGDHSLAMSNETRTYEILDAEVPA